MLTTFKCRKVDTGQARLEGDLSPYWLQSPGHAVPRSRSRSTGHCHMCVRFPSDISRVEGIGIVCPEGLGSRPSVVQTRHFLQAKGDVGSQGGPSLNGKLHWVIVVGDDI